MPNISGVEHDAENKERLGGGQTSQVYDMESQGPGHAYDASSFDSAARKCHERVLGRQNPPEGTPSDEPNYS